MLREKPVQRDCLEGFEANIKTHRRLNEDIGRAQLTRKISQVETTIPREQSNAGPFVHLNSQHRNIGSRGLLLFSPLSDDSLVRAFALS